MIISVLVRIFFLFVMKRLVICRIRTIVMCLHNYADGNGLCFVCQDMLSETLLCFGASSTTVDEGDGNEVANPLNYSISTL